MFGPKHRRQGRHRLRPERDAVSEALVKLVANPNFTNDDGTLGLAGLKNGTLDAYFSGSWDAANVQKALGDKYGAATRPDLQGRRQGLPDEGPRRFQGDWHEPEHEGT